MFGDSATRERVARELRYQNESVQRPQILDPNVIQTELIALIDWIQKQGLRLCVTSLRLDHGSDAFLGQPPDLIGTHWKGWAIDFWFLNSDRWDDYMDPNSHEFRAGLQIVARAPFELEVGLGGSANTPANELAAGPTWFCDNKSDHLHASAKRSS